MKIENDVYLEHLDKGYYVTGDNFTSPFFPEQHQAMAWYKHMKSFVLPESCIDTMHEALEVIASMNLIRIQNWMYANDQSHLYTQIVSMMLPLEQGMRELIITIARSAVSGISWHPGESEEKARMITALKMIGYSDTRMSLEQIRNHAR